MKEFDKTYNECLNMIDENSLKSLATAGLLGLGNIAGVSPTAQASHPYSHNTSRGIRNNNPGNIEYKQSSERWEGSIGNDGRFVIFAEMKWGVRALMRTLITYYRKYNLNTVTKIIQRWAPPSENDTNQYIKNVSSWMGVDPNQELNLGRVETLKKLAYAITRQETGYKLDDKTLDDATNILYSKYYKR